MERERERERERKGVRTSLCVWHADGGARRKMNVDVRRFSEAKERKGGGGGVARVCMGGLNGIWEDFMDRC